MSTDLRPDMLSRFHGFRDDGHAIKVFRAALITQELSRKYQDFGWMLIKGDDMWMRIYRLIADSVATPGPVFIRTAGLEEAWTVSILRNFTFARSVCKVLTGSVGCSHEIETIVL